MKRVRTRRARRWLAAFTLIELMVSIGVGGVAITAIYAIGSASTRQFQQQQQIATMQSSLRFAMHQVKSDIARAGFMASARAAATPPFSNRLCGGTISNALSSAATGWVAGISMFDNNPPGNTSSPRTDTAAASAGLVANENNGFTADTLMLVGNYETSHEYPITRRSNSQVAISATSQGALSDFAWTNAGAAQPGYNAAIAAMIFPIGSLVRIVTAEQQQHYATVSANVNVDVNGELVIPFAPALTVDCENVAFIAPLSVIRYSAAETPTTGAASATIDSAPTLRPSSQGAIAQLRRVEMDPSNKANPLASRPNVRFVLDFLAAFNVWFTMNGATAAGQPDTYAVGNRINTDTGGGNPNEEPQRVRSVFIELAARMPSVDSTMPWTAAGCANLRCYQVGTAGAQPLSANFASRVRVMRSEVFIPNIAYEGY